MSNTVNDDFKNMLLDFKNDLIQIIDNKLERLVSDQINLKTRIEDQERKIRFLDTEVRKRNLIFFGIIENEQTYEQLEILITDIIKNIMKVQIEVSDIDFLKRIGKRAGDNVRPILLGLVSFRKKMEIIKSKRFLADCDFMVREDFSTEVLNRRKELQPEVDELRRKGKNAVLRHDRIIILDERLPTNRPREQTPASALVNEKKREQSKSPSMERPPNKKHETKRFRPTGGKLSNSSSGKHYSISEYLRPQLPTLDANKLLLGASTADTDLSDPKNGL